jgi:tetratricopeptide (TPR) repeat protein
VSQELDQELHRRVAELCERGDAHVEAGELDLAVEKYEEALSLLPPPMSRWNASTWILTALGDAFFLKKEWRQARSALDDATRCPRGLDNPFIHLRLGQIELELGNRGRAIDELGRAYLGAAEEIFAGEDPKYLALAEEGARGKRGDGEG